MKRDTIEPPPVFDNRFDRFKYRLKNIYWYHYKWHVLSALVVGAMATSFIVSYVTNKTPDLIIMVVSERGLDYNAASAMEGEIGAYIGDVNGDGEERVDIIVINLNDPATELAARTMLIAQIQREDILLVIADPWAMEQMGDLFPYRDISAYMPGQERLVDISKSEKLLALAPYEDAEYYAGLVEKENDDQAHIEVPVKAIEFFLQ